jgi:hypothetical protein
MRDADGSQRHREVRNDVDCAERDQVDVQVGAGGYIGFLLSPEQPLRRVLSARINECDGPRYDIVRAAASETKAKTAKALACIVNKVGEKITTRCSKTG